MPMKYILGSHLGKGSSTCFWVRVVLAVVDLLGAHEMHGLHYGGEGKELARRNFNAPSARL